MPNFGILRDKQNIPATKKDTSNQSKIFKRTNVARPGIPQRVQRSQQKRKHDEVEPQPPAFHGGIQKNTKVEIQSTAHDMRDLKSDKPNVMKIVNPTCDSTDTAPIVTFNGPREAFKMKAEVFDVLDVVLAKAEKIPILKHVAEDQQVPKSLTMLSAAIREVEKTAPGANPEEENKSVTLKTIKETTGAAKIKNAQRIGSAIPDAVKILNNVIVKTEENRRSRNSELTNIPYDPFFGTQSEYHEDILNYLMELEMKVSKPKPGYMDKQPEVTATMRTKLVDWLVHIFQGTNEKVLHMTVHFIDTFLSRMSVVKSKLQLLACAAGMVACKTEEVYIQNAQYWIILGGETFTRSQLLKMERIILSVMKFELCRPTIVCFIRHVCYIGDVSAKEAILANYLSELVLVEGDVYLHYSPSLLASAAIALARLTLGRSDFWSKELKDLTHHTLQQLRPIFGLLRKTYNNALKTPKTNVYKKYAHKKYLEVAKLKLK